MNLKEIAALKAIEFVKEGMTIGLGTGSTVKYFIEEVGRLCQEGMNLKGVATSLQTEKLARDLNIPLLQIDEVDYLDLGVDGADEVDLEFNAIKGGGGALFREKMVASLAKEVIWVVDESKVVQKLGKFHLPVEILPFGYIQTMKRLQDFNPVLRLQDNKPFITDNGHYILDLHLGVGFNVLNVQKTLLNTIGVLETGLFINMCKRVIVGTNEGVKVFENNLK